MESSYQILINELSDMVNKSQYFNPLFSWVIVVYTYFSIGVHGGKIWKYLFYFATCGFIASITNVVYTISKSLGMDQVKFVHLLWIEHFFWGVNEWGYMYVNFLKIKACINKLNKKFWVVILYSLLVYTIAIRMVISYMVVTGTKKVYLENKKTGKNDKYDEKIPGYFNSALYFPLGVICTVFIFLIFQKFLTEQNTEKRSILSVLLHSTLSRMLFVSLLFIGMSIIVFFSENGVAGFIRRLLWRTKGNLGIIFLVDILLLRIDFDKNKLLEQTRKIKQINYDNSYNTIDIDIDPPIIPPVPPVSQNINMNMEYTNKLLSRSKSINDLYKNFPLSKGIRDDALPYMNPSMVENRDLSRSNSFNYSTYYSRNNNNNKKIANSLKMNTSPPLAYSNYNYDKPSSSNDSTYYPNSLPRKTNNNNLAVETASITNSLYNSMSRLHPGTISIENVDPSNVSSNYGSLTRSLSQKAPVDNYPGSLSRSQSQSGRVVKDTYPGSLNRSLSGRTRTDPKYGSLKRKHPGNIVMENPEFEE